MIFWASSEVYQPADSSSELVRRAVVSYLDQALAVSSLRGLAAELRYIPIIMPEEMKEKYSERSKLRKKELVYVCAPQLDYEVFIRGSLEQQLDEYVRGIMLSVPHLSELGATPRQVEEFTEILNGAASRILLERPDQTRH